MEEHPKTEKKKHIHLVRCLYNIRIFAFSYYPFSFPLATQKSPTCTATTTTTTASEKLIHFHRVAQKQKAFLLSFFISFPLLVDSKKSNSLENQKSQSEQGAGAEEVELESKELYELHVHCEYIYVFFL